MNYRRDTPHQSSAIAILGTGKHIAVFVADKNPSVCEGIVALAAAMGLASKTFSSASQFLENVNLHQLGCIVADLCLPDMDGLQFQERLNSLGSVLPVIFIGEAIGVRTAVQAMRNGAVTVLEKPFQPEQLRDALRVGIVRNRSLRELRQAKAQLWERFGSLDPREREVMMRVIDGLPNKIIARELGVCQRTAAQIRAAVFEKMGAESAVTLARMVGDLRQLEHEECRVASPHDSSLLCQDMLSVN